MFAQEKANISGCEKDEQVCRPNMQFFFLSGVFLCRQAGLEPLELSDPPASTTHVAGTMAECHRA